jgi:hypothetical protein
LALLVGLGVGLVYSWVISPKHIVDAAPSALRADFKDEYRSVIAAAYAATNNLPRARARLSLLGDPDSAEALNAQAQRMRARGEQFEHADRVAALALALGEDVGSAPVSFPTAEITNSVDREITSIATSAPEFIEAPLDLTETPQIIDTQTQPVVVESTPRPTHTPVPTLGEPFALTGQESVCDSNLPDGLLQVMVLNPTRRQLAGAEITITWDGGKESFFTGLKPELGNGYADYVMMPDTTYTVQLARGSDVALGITAPICQTADGQNFSGSIKLTFQQP